MATRLAEVVKAASKGIGTVEVSVEHPHKGAVARQLTGVLRVDRLDFVPASTRCFACHRPLTSGTAYIVKTPAGAEHPYGPTCVERRVPGAKNQVYPDFTRASRNPPSEGVSLKRASSKVKRSQFSFEEEYLILRYEKLRGFSIPGFELLDGVFNRYKEGGALSDHDRDFVKKLMAKIPASKFPGLSMENLQACYAYSHCLSQAILMLPEDKRNFLSKLLADLQTKLYLTDHQVEAANRWLTKFSEFPELDAAPFEWAKHKTD
ncbi:hypothetical protein [Trichlorobacter lovleyi]|uniref:hypothetical protein n=1 Tax=Trichlorobacter lovleyi TaxID=313985 RepID=UPI0022409FC1|nr:hypothetical protein [Trichlorobacter lovleyi]